MNNKPRHAIIHSLLALCAGLLLAVGLAHADPSGQVGRISVLDGAATLYPERAAAGQPAAVNWPVAEGAVLETGRGSRAEIWIGSTTVRLAGDTRLEFAALDDDRVSLRLTAGIVTLAVRDPEQARELQLSTPNAVGRFEPGHYRIEVGPTRSNFVTLSGRTLTLIDGRELSVPAGRSASIDERSADLYGLPVRDPFDDWTAARENASQPGRSAYYVSPRMTGYDDLDRHGEWVSTGEYGSLWLPRDVPFGWEPYRDGRWVWLSPWGWTWVDNMPWGFAPFHYGRWVEFGGRWAWSPGLYVSRPVYAPALVVWLGQPQARSSHGPGAAWRPLAPNQDFVPHYRASPGHVERLNSGWRPRPDGHDGAWRDRSPGTVWRYESRPHAAPQVMPQTAPQAVPQARPQNRPETGAPMRFEAAPERRSPEQERWRERHQGDERSRSAAPVAPSIAVPATPAIVAPQSAPQTAPAPAPRQETPSWREERRNQWREERREQRVDMPPTPARPMEMPRERPATALPAPAPSAPFRAAPEERRNEVRERREERRDERRERN